LRALLGPTNDDGEKESGAEGGGGGIKRAEVSN